MREELRQYADDAYEMVRSISEDIGPRVPGTEGEKKLHGYMSQKLNDIGLKPKTEKFLFAPHASIGGLPYVGWGGIATGVLLLLALILSGIDGITRWGEIAVLAFGTLYVILFLTWVVASVFKYSTFFDWCFRQEVSHNTYAQLVPEDGKFDYTIYLTGHTDTSWTLKHSAATRGKINPIVIFLKLGVGAISAALLCVIMILTFVLTLVAVYGGYIDAITALGYVHHISTYLVPVLMLGSFFMTLYNDKNHRAASPGAMDNATGIAISYQVVKYFKENPDKAPARCRIVDLNVGAEEAGLRGSIDFVRRHKDDGMLEHAYHLNIDSIADKDYFEVIHGDAWLCPHFDKGLRDMFKEAMTEAGIQKPGDIANPVGGCDSTPFQKAGVRSITFAAQNPTMTDYYHTLYDEVGRFDAETVGLGMDVVLRVIDKIAEQENNK